MITITGCLESIKLTNLLHATDQIYAVDATGCLFYFMVLMLRESIPTLQPPLLDGARAEALNIRYTRTFFANISSVYWPGPLHLRQEEHDEPCLQTHRLCYREQGYEPAQRTQDFLTTGSMATHQTI